MDAGMTCALNNGERDERRGVAGDGGKRLCWESKGPAVVGSSRLALYKGCRGDGSPAKALLCKKCYAPVARIGCGRLQLPLEAELLRFVGPELRSSFDFLYAGMCGSQN